MAQRTRLFTAEDFARLPDDDFRYELADGRVIRMSPPGFRHGAVVVALASLLRPYVKAQGLGELVTESGFKLASDPDTVRGPDLAFVRRERMSQTGLPAGFWPGAPDLAVEVLSPDDSASEIRVKVSEYLRAGVRLVWVVDPDRGDVTVHRAFAPPTTLGGDGMLDGGDVLPGFACPVRRVFE